MRPPSRYFFSLLEIALTFIPLYKIAFTRAKRRKNINSADDMVIWSDFKHFFSSCNKTSANAVSSELLGDRKHAESVYVGIVRVARNRAYLS